VCTKSLDDIVDDLNGVIIALTTPVISSFGWFNSSCLM